jgi:hypothetical protein
MQAKRVDERLGEEGQYPFPRLQPGEYGKGLDGIWYCVPPHWENARPGNLGAHSISEHEDGTITASPSILISDGRGHSWHGYLERGMWREC